MKGNVERNAEAAARAAAKKVEATPQRFLENGAAFEIIHQGPLEKKHPRYPYFQDRYVALYADRIEYYEEENDLRKRNAPNGIFYLSKILGQIDLEKDGNKGIITFKVPDKSNSSKPREVVLKAPYEKAESWYNAIEKAKKERIEAIRQHRVNAPVQASPPIPHVELSTTERIASGFGNNNQFAISGGKRKTRKTLRKRKIQHKTRRHH